MIEVKQAIYDRYALSDNPFRSAVTALCDYENVSKAIPPYATYRITGMGDGDTFTATIFDPVVIQFRVFSAKKSSDECMDALLKCFYRYKSVVLYPAAKYCKFKLLRGTVIPPFKNEKDVFKNWQGSVDFTARIQAIKEV